MQAKRDAAAAAAEQHVDDDDDDDDVFDGNEQRGCGEVDAAAAVRRSPSGDSFATLAAENQLDKLDKLDKRLVSGSRVELSGLQDRLSIASVRTPTDYVALPSVRVFAVFLPRPVGRQWRTEDGIRG